MSNEVPVQKISAAQARALLPELEASGLPLAEFARQRNVALLHHSKPTLWGLNLRQVH